jgi:hypothetical protein
MFGKTTSFDVIKFNLLTFSQNNAIKIDESSKLHPTSTVFQTWAFITFLGWIQLKLVLHRSKENNRLYALVLCHESLE